MEAEICGFTPDIGLVVGILFDGVKGEGIGEGDDSDTEVELVLIVLETFALIANEGALDRDDAGVDIDLDGVVDDAAEGGRGGFVVEEIEFALGLFCEMAFGDDLFTDDAVVNVCEADPEGLLKLVVFIL